MADKRFFKLEGPFNLGELANITGSTVDENKSGRIVKDVAALDVADSDKITFFENKKYLDQFKNTKAGACFVRPEFASMAPEGTICIINKNPYKAYALAARAFYPQEIDASIGISDRAIVDSSAVIGENTVVKPGVVIEANAKIGKNCVIGANAVIGTGVEIGDNCKIGATACIMCALIGKGVVVYPGAIIGRPGFGFAIDYETGFTSVPQLGRVIIEDEVQVGANTTIDRGAGPDTVIGRGTRIDNLVQIGHNVKVGQYCVIVSQVGISGSSKIGDFVMLGGQVGIAGHLNIGSGVRLGGQSGVIQDIPPGNGTEYMGTPAIPLKQYMRQAITLAKLVKKRNLKSDD